MGLWSPEVPPQLRKAVLAAVLEASPAGERGFGHEAPSLSVSTAGGPLRPRGGGCVSEVRGQLPGLRGQSVTADCLVRNGMVRSQGYAREGSSIACPLATHWKESNTGHGGDPCRCLVRLLADLRQEAVIILVSNLDLCSDSGPFKGQ